MITSLSNTDKTQAIALLFYNGSKVFADLACLIGEHRATVALGLCFDICVYEEAVVVQKSKHISNSAFINPQGTEGVDILIEQLAVELLKSMKELSLIDEVGALQYELVKLDNFKLVISPRFADVKIPTHLRAA